MIIYKINFDKNKRIHFSIKDKKVFIKCMGILEKISNIIKSKLNSEILCSKTKGGLQSLYESIMFIDSIYRKDENCYLKCF